MNSETNLHFKSTLTSEFFCIFASSFHPFGGKKWKSPRLRWEKNEDPFISGGASTLDSPPAALTPDTPSFHPPRRLKVTAFLFAEFLWVLQSLETLQMSWWWFPFSKHMGNTSIRERPAPQKKIWGQKERRRLASWAQRAGSPEPHCSDGQPAFAAGVYSFSSAQHLQQVCIS